MACLLSYVISEMRSKWSWWRKLSIMIDKILSSVCWDSFLFYERSNIYCSSMFVRYLWRLLNSLEDDRFSQRMRIGEYYKNTSQLLFISYHRFMVQENKTILYIKVTRVIIRFHITINFNFSSFFLCIR